MGTVLCPRENADDGRADIVGLFPDLTKALGRSRCGIRSVERGQLWPPVERFPDETMWADEYGERPIVGPEHREVGSPPTERRRTYLDASKVHERSQSPQVLGHFRLVEHCMGLGVERSSAHLR